MKRGFLLLLAGVVAIAWFVVPASARPSSNRIRTDRVVVAAPPQRSTTTTSTIAPSTTLAPTTVATTVPAAVTTTPPSTTEAADETLTREDPAATRLRRITYALAGLGGLILVLTVVFWKVTRPALLLPPKDVAPTPAGSSGAEPAGARPATAGAGPAPALPTAPALPAAPAKIPASVILATPPAASLASTLVTALPSGASSAAAPLDDPPPSGEPAIDAPAPLDDIPLGAPKPLVGNDSAWIIEPQSNSGLIADTPTATDFPPDDAASAEPPSSEPILGDPADPSSPDVSGDPATSGDIPHETKALISALSAIPDKEPTRVRFDDPPVERVRQRRSPAGAVQPRVTERPEVETTGETSGESTGSRSEPAGAPGFDRIAKEATAKQHAVPVESHEVVTEARAVEPKRVERMPSGIVDDMAVMASALSSLPPRELPDLPPVGEFYDQDLDPGDPPGRP